MKIIRKVRVTHPLGLHIRPAAELARVLQDTQSRVLLTYRQETVDPRSIVAVLTLAIQKDSVVTIVVDGEDAQTVMEQITRTLDHHLSKRAHAEGCDAVRT
ncbi:MAG: HPr family phosphocarrier protein [Chlamydiia bacterium]